MRDFSQLLVAASIVAAAAEPVLAQVSTTPVPVTPALIPVRRAPADLDQLTVLYNVSDWSALQTLARDLVCVIARSGGATGGDEEPYETCATAPKPTAPPGPAASALDLASHHVALLWIGTDAFGKTRLLRAVVSDADREPDDLDLPGLSAAGDRQLTEVFLSRSPLGRIASVYTSTRENDPILAQLPAFAQALAGPLFATTGSIAGRIPGLANRGVQEPARPLLWATVRRVGLPFRRASVRFQVSAREPVSSAAFAEAAARLASSLAFSEVPHQPCARTLAATLSEELPPVTQSAVCSAPAARSADCLASFDRVLAASFDRTVGACEGGKPSRDAGNALETVDERFRELVQTGTSSSADLDLTFKNRPPTHFALGAGAAVIVGASLTKPRVDTKSGVLVADPLGRVVTLALVNWSPAGYDGKRAAIEPAERVRPFVGAALTPDFGPAFGVNVLVARGLGVTAGAAILFGKGADASQIGGTPASPADPYDLSLARAFFVGLTYSSK